MATVKAHRFPVSIQWQEGRLTQASAPGKPAVPKIVLMRPEDGIEARGTSNPYFSAHAIGEEPDALGSSNAHDRAMQRVAVTAHLRDGAEAEARELIDAGPPFDLGDAGFEQHSVFVGSDLVVFVFEGDDIERRLTELVNDPVRAAGFGAWAPVRAESPRVAHETYFWSRKENTMKKIVIATDGSRSALEAVEYGLELATDQDAEPIFVHVAPTTEVLPVTGFGMGTPVSVPHEPDEHDRASLDAAVEIAAAKGLEAKAELLSGNAAHAIVAYADSVDADLIVVGSRGHGTIAGALLGSVSRSVLREAKRPVLVIRAAADRVESGGVTDDVATRTGLPTRVGTARREKSPR